LVGIRAYPAVLDALATVNSACGRAIRKVETMQPEEITAENLETYEVWELAALVRVDWENVNFAARPYVDAMFQIHHIDDYYGQDRGRAICAYFLANATTWRGDVARLVKAEIRRRLAR